MSIPLEKHWNQKSTRTSDALNSSSVPMPGLTVQTTAVLTVSGTVPMLLLILLKRIFVTFEGETAEKTIITNLA